ncbi:MAG: hypothetical protein QG671_1957, partial [Actinomycetota bacterium]|nr:hypothetical protein [Actinomycetota bacterium]
MGFRTCLISGGAFHRHKSAPGRIRTCNRPGRNRLLYPLSYGRLRVMPASHTIMADE